MVLVGTKAGIHAVDEEQPHSQIEVVHLVQHATGWWAVDPQGRIWHDDDHVADAPDGVRINCLQPTADGVWLGADSARLFLLQDGVIVEDQFFADAPGRETWHTPWGGPADVRSLAHEPDGALFVNVHVGGILRYDNTGLVPTVPIESDVHQVVSHPGRAAAVMAATAWGLAQSSNGHDFEFRTEGFTARYCRAVAVWEDTVLVSASRGPRGGGATVYRGPLQGGPLQPCNGGLPDEFEGNVDTHCLFAGPDAFFVGNGGNVWASGDRGETWEKVAAGLPPITCLA
ncbi:MAG TPA: hypothetical protein VHL52_07420 [Acidimicrobiia bacterium]|nr:hypothetical protein [Acidimicrobiia bacterium]